MPSSKFPPNVRLASSGGSYYRVIDNLRSGGNGTAYLVTCDHGKLLGCLSVIKVLDSWKPPDRFDRFVREINTLKALHHPAIVQVYDHGFVGISRSGAKVPEIEFPFYAMEFYPRTLSDVIRETHPLQSKLLYASQLCSALIEVEALQAVHRDIKPSNIFVSGGDCVLGDFGLLRAVSSDDHSPQAMARNYPSPELLAYESGGAPPGTASDVFQLGLVLAELFTRQIPISRDGEGVAFKKVQPIGGVFGKRTRDVISSMLECDESKRASARKAAQDFSRILTDLLSGNVKLLGKAV